MLSPSSASSSCAFSSHIFQRLLVLTLLSISASTLGRCSSTTPGASTLLLTSPFPALETDISSSTSQGHCHLRHLLLPHHVLPRPRHLLYVSFPFLPSSPSRSLAISPPSPFSHHIISTPSILSLPFLLRATQTDSPFTTDHFFRKNERAIPPAEMDLVSGSREEQDEEDFDQHSTTQKGLGSRIMAYVL
jgi:hypothetical protein